MGKVEEEEDSGDLLWKTWNNTCRNPRFLIQKEESISKTMEVPDSILGVQPPSAQETDDVGRLQLTGL